jgi:ADP-ribosylglycohydrolase
MSSTDKCFDIGNTVRKALHHFEKTGNPLSGPTDPRSAGNGSIMRLAPVPLVYALQPKQAIELSGESSRTTHGAKAAVDACRYLGGLIVGAIHGAEKHELLSSHYCPIPNYWESAPLVAEIDEIAAGSFKEKTPPVNVNPISSFFGATPSSSSNIRGTGYVVASLEAALWAFFMSRSFEEGCLLAVNLGDDADTTGAVYGQLAGAFYGESEIPQSWRDKLAMKETIESLSDRLLELSLNNPFH